MEREGEEMMKNIEKRESSESEREREKEEERIIITYTFQK